MPLGVGTLLGALMAFVLLFLEPWGTDRFQEPWRLVRLSGYGLCIAVAFLAVHAVDRLRWRRRASGWRVADEVVSVLLLMPTIFVLTFLYRAWAIGGLEPSWRGLLEWSALFGLPLVPLLAPPAVLFKLGLLRWTASRSPQPNVLRIRGRNREDRLRLVPSDFLYAEAQQNYTVVHYLQGSQVRQRMIRATLAELEAQVPGALRIHRSYLVNPQQLLAVEGNARRRRVKMRGTQNVLPMSPAFDLDQLPKAILNGEDASLATGDALP